MNINFTDLEKLIKLAERSDINSLEVTDGDTRISIVCQPDGNENSNQAVSHISNNNKGLNLSTNLDASSASSSEQRTTASTGGNKTNTNNVSKGTAEKAATEDGKNQVSAPMLGTFYLRSEPTADEFVKVGEQVDVGQTLCIIEAMKMMHEVKADVACTIKEVLVDEGDVVEYGQPLFIIEPNS